MIIFVKRFARLILGLFVFAVGIVFAINANIGYAPWDVFHAGLSKTMGITFGSASITVGLIIVVLTVALGERVGLGTLLNMLLIGMFLDLIMAGGWIPIAPNFFIGLLMMVVAMVTMGIASILYIGSGFGAGPRDSLMVAVTRLTKLPVGVCRGAIEVTAVLAGWMLGGMVGVGTVFTALTIGYFIQKTFKVFRFDATKVKHETLIETYKSLTKAIK